MAALAPAFVVHGSPPFGLLPGRACARRTAAPKRLRVASIRLSAEPDNRNPAPVSTPSQASQHAAKANGAPRPENPADSVPKPEHRGAPAPQIDPLGKDAGAEADQSPQRSVPISIGPLSTAVPTRWLLYLVPFFWGSFAPAVRYLFAQEQHPDPSVFNTIRLVLSTMIYAPVLAAEFNAYRKRNTPDADPDRSFDFAIAGTELGIFVFLANVAQVLGLQQTSASRAAFLVQLQTVFVPVLSGLLGLAKISRKTWISSLVAVGGVALLSSDKSHGSVSSITGDALEVLSALFFSTYIIRLSKYCNNVAPNPLVATKIAVQAVLSLIWAASAELFAFWNHPTGSSLVADEKAPWTFSAVLISFVVVVWTGLMSSAASGWAQTRGQQGVPPSEAVVIFASQPLWASALAACVLGESFGPKGFAGGALIVAATLIAAKPDKPSAEESTIDT